MQSVPVQKTASTWSQRHPEGQTGVLLEGLQSSGIIALFSSILEHVKVFIKGDKEEKLSF